MRATGGFGTLIEKAGRRRATDLGFAGKGIAMSHQALLFVKVVGREE